MASLSGLFNLQAFTDAGEPASGYRLYTYAPGTTTHKAAYTDAAETVPHTYVSDGAGGLYIALNARGELPAPLFLASGGYDIALKTPTGALVWSRRAEGAGDAISSILVDIGSPASGKGDALVAVKKTATGSTATTQHEVNERTLNVLDFMSDAQRTDFLTGAATLDLATPINAALAAAHAMTFGSTTDPYGALAIGSTVVEFPAGKGLVSSASLAWYESTAIRGKGRNSTVLVCTYNGRIIEQQPSANYNAFGLEISGLTIIGDRTKTSQVGIAMLRPYSSLIRDVRVMRSGGDGILIRQGLQPRLEDVDCLQCVGAGLHVMDGIDTWASVSSNNYPTNGLLSVNGHYGFNDGPGVKFSGTGTSTLGKVNNCTFIGGGIEYNYFSSPARTGQNVEDFSAAYFANTFDSVWFEGGTWSGATSCVQYHILKTGADVTNTLVLRNCRHTGQGATGNTDRFVKVTVGTVVDHGSQGTQNLYRTIGGSNAPYQLTKATAKVNLINVSGCTLLPDSAWVEDETNATTGLYNNARVLNFGSVQGAHTVRTDSGDSALDAYRNGDNFPFLQLVGDRSLRLGSGAAATDVGIQRTAADTIGMLTGDFFDAGAAWNGSHLKMGGYRLWVDGSGRLRIKSGAPASDTDGTVVGTQV